ncbi:helix-turn-helix transcriptional regulator [Acutalibacter muris]|uniref:Helix-turn-helix transcriptional regulator n=1 Tax=Acutalibacter muris TaxID=1796620 RepID=A0A1Z2XSH2_9FIRM|nr:helix-turn-helix transcriptional regulator [Acutalibacter muris]ANU55364.1 XRE family transcriptional regulator [Hungateiclostridiaceae bacterium KB18]ASB41402.1 XRE family transcriptional regulator [Acutalibacter muris]QQR30661.1 helix-turn-helix transcriptional regulator [Acutalibacter muris]
MKVSYKKLWVMLSEREISKATLRKQAGLSSATFTKLRKNQEVTLAVMLKIADVLNCNARDMMGFIKDEDISPDASSLDTNN